MSFLDLPSQKILNKVICDFHFKENNFMNYKRERLTKTNAVPTIYISPKNQEEVDLVTSPTEWVLENQKSAIPSSFRRSSNYSINVDESGTASDSFVFEEEQPPSPKKVKLETPLNSTMRILNSSVSSSGGAITVRKIVKKTPNAIDSPEVVKQHSGDYTIIRPVQKTPVKAVPKIVKQEILQPSSFEDLPASLVEVVLPPTNYAKPQSSSTYTKSQPSPTRSVTDDLKPAILDSIKQIAEIKEMMLNRKPEFVAVPQPERPTEQEANISQSQLNKVQLFNGIKRYLSPSMSALLRMELFAAPDREYKKDEKIICQELLQLGDKTYSHLADEWRLRLPAKKDVQDWLDEQMAEEDDDAS